MTGMVYISPNWTWSDMRFRPVFQANNALVTTYPWRKRPQRYGIRDLICQTWEGVMYFDGYLWPTVVVACIFCSCNVDATVLMKYGIRWNEWTRGRLIRSKRDTKQRCIQVNEYIKILCLLFTWGNLGWYPERWPLRSLKRPQRTSLGSYTRLDSFRYLSPNSKLVSIPSPKTRTILTSF